MSSSFSAPARKCDYRPSSQDGTQINLHLINQARIERLAEHVSATLKEDACDASLTQIFEHSGQGLALIN